MSKQIIIPQPDGDLEEWARTLTTQLNKLVQVLGSQTAVIAPIFNQSGQEVINSEGYVIDGLGRVVVDFTGLHVYDITGFQVIDGPNVYIDTQHILDQAVGAGKLAASAIVAGDAVIANAAISDAQIADLNANKINAGDIAAERIEANIVTALNGKFATLAALAANLGVVEIKAGGAIFTEGAIAYDTGTGIWAGDHEGVQKFRAGTPGGEFIRWTGTELEIFTPQLVLTAGNATFSGTLSAADGIFSGTLNAVDGTFTGILDGATGMFSGTLAAGVLSSSSFESIEEQYFVPGTYTITVPALPSGWFSISIHVVLQGAGAGGGRGGSWNNGQYLMGGGGGGAGQFVEFFIHSATPAAEYTLTVGAGGTAGPSLHSSGSNGGNTVWESTVALGGTGGTGGSIGGPNRGLGGSIGGQDGGGTLITGEPYGGSGGTSNFSPGGQGGTSVNYHGQNGGPGAGGGGGYCYGKDLSGSAGNGGNGRALITFFDPNFVVLNNRYANLIAWLDTLGFGSVPSGAR